MRKYETQLIVAAENQFQGLEHHLADLGARGFEVKAIWNMPCDSNGSGRCLMVLQRETIVQALNISKEQAQEMIRKGFAERKKHRG